ncbi:MAG: hypothetical protein Q6363_010600 [Candidatus Njordarchaeota archaeon]
MSIIKKVVEKFHEKFYPEVKVAYVGSGHKSHAFIFSGPFCASCGLYDYFDDFAIMLSEHLGEKYVPTEIDKVDGEDMWVVIFEAIDKKTKRYER